MAKTKLKVAHLLDKSATARLSHIATEANICRAQSRPIKGCKALYDFDLMDDAAQARYRETQLPLPELDLFKVSQARLSGRYALIVQGHLFDTSMRELPSANLPHRLCGSLPILSDAALGLYDYDDTARPVKSIKDPALLLASTGDHMHHHWVFDVCSKFYVWDVLLKRSVKLAIPNTLKGYQRKAYADLGVTEYDVIEFDPNSYTDFDTLYVSPCLSQVDWAVPEAFLHLRQAFFSAYNITGAEKKPTRKLFINRQDMPDETRTLLNERDLIGRCGDKGFVSVSGSDFSMEEQIRHFAQTGECIIVHGSAGANVLFGNLHMKCIHLHPDAVARFRAHGRTNGIIGHDYSYVFGMSFFRRERFHANPWFIDPKSLKKALSNL